MEWGSSDHIAHLITTYGLLAIAVIIALESMGLQKWLHKFGRCGRWIGCLTAGTVVLANQKRR